ncbi:MAG: FAD-dependent oxidoreductase [Pseudomonadota bacterium]
MPAYDFDLGIIGGGAAGLTVAAGSARAGAKTLLIEKETRLGGDCLHFGCVPSKTLIKTAKVRHLAQNAPAFGLPEASLPPVDFRLVRQHIRDVIEKIQVHDSAARFCELGARVIFGDPEFTDDHQATIDGQAYSARTWVLACGSSPAPLPLKNLSRNAYLTNREIFYLDALPSSMIILGAGPMAIEMAQAFGRLGTKVQVVQRSSGILTREDPDLAQAVQAALEAEGVVFHLNAQVLDIADQGGVKNARIFSPDKGERLLRGQALLGALGRTPNTAGLALEKAGVDHGPKGIVTDNRLRTSRKHIFAAGDVTGGPQFTHAAGYQGGIVTANAVFHLPRRVDYSLMPHCTFTDPELAGVGHNEMSARAEGLEYRVLVEEFEQNDRFLTEGGTSGKLKLLIDPRGRPLGVQILGPSAGEILSQWITVLGGKIKLSTLAGSILPYPTLAEINKRVAGAFLAPKIFSENVKKTLKFFFDFKGRACLPPRDPQS